MRKVLSPFILLIFFMNKAICQIEIPEIIPPSPETAALFKYVDYPVDYSTGIPQISIPLYTVTSGDLTLPISISYHASGRKVKDDTGPIGLGWVLNCGGMISRTVYGQPDEVSSFPSIFKKANELTNQDNYQEIASLYYGYQGNDTEYDIFSYRLPSGSGKFITADDQGIKLMPLKPFYLDGLGYNFPSIIKDDKGITYSFHESEWTLFNPLDPNRGSIAIPTAKYLTLMTSADGIDSIQFTYKSFTIINNFPLESYTIYDDIQGDDDLRRSLITQNPRHTNTDAREYTAKRIKEIIFKGGKVVINLEDSSDRILNIQILNNNGEIIKTIEFSRSFLDSNGPISYYKLDNVIIKDSNNDVTERYSLEYYPSEFFYGQSRDWWGYRNGSDQRDLIPFYDIVDYNFTTRTIGTGANRNSKESSMRMGMLKKITYPTGGTTEFIFEGNETTFQNNIVPCGGMRIAQIKTTDGNGKLIVRSFEYPVGSLILFPYQKYTGIEKRTFYGLDQSRPTYHAASYSTRVYSSDMPSNLSYYFDHPIYYQTVDEYLGTSTDNIGKITYVYESNRQNSISQFNGPNFSQVHDPMGGNILAPYSPVKVDNEILPYYVYEYNFWKDRTLIQTSYDKNAGRDDQGQIIYENVKTIEYNYNYVETDTLRGMKFYKFCEIPKGGGTPDRNEAWAADYLGFPIFLLGDYYISIGKKELASTVETEVGDNTVVVKKTDYFYNENHLVNETRQYVNNNDILKTISKFPSDFDDVTSQKMEALNMLNYVVEQEEFRNDIRLKTVKTTYAEWDDNRIAPTSVSILPKGASEFRNILSFTAYDDAGNLQSVSKSNDINNVFLYSYSQNLPIAKIENSDLSTVINVLGGQPVVDAFSKRVSPTDAEVRTFLAPLRNDTRLKNARVTTYTYEPLTGISSVTDQNDVTTYYKYDAAGRLEYIKDKDENILLNNQYKYKN